MAPPAPCPNCGLHLAGIAGICPRCGCRFGTPVAPSTGARRAGALAIGAGALMMLTGGYCTLPAVLGAPEDRGYAPLFLPWSVPTLLAGAVLIAVARTRSAELTRSGWVIAGRVLLLVLGLSLALAGGALGLLNVVWLEGSRPRGFDLALGLDCLLIVAAGVGLCVRAWGATGSWRRLPR